MANPDHIDWLLLGVDLWNARRENEHFRPDLEPILKTDGNLQGESGKASWGCI